jgi:hypothetical protein
MISAAAQQNDGREEFLNDFRRTIELSLPRLFEISEAKSGIPRSEGSGRRKKSLAI